MSPDHSGPGHPGPGHSGPDSPAMTVTAARRPPDDTQVLGVPVFRGPKSPRGSGAELDWAYLEARGFEGKVGETLAVPADDGSTVVAVGVGDPASLDAEALRRAAAALVKAAWRSRSVATTLLAAVGAPGGGIDQADAAQAVAEGAALAAYRFGTYKAEARACRIESFTVVGSGAGVPDGVDRANRICAGVALARNLVNEPAGAMTPSRLAGIAEGIAAANGLQCSVLDESAIEAERLGGLAGVARGSDEPARLIRLTYDPPGATAGIALVGKGITFDSGGLSIKTAEGMETMKTDMSGAAAVLGAMSVIPALGPKVKVVAIIPATENMPGGRATKPGDVLRIRNGTTVEVLNTDAEGRLVLADGLSLAVEAGVDAILDLATLTGACVIALGTRIAGLMGNHQGWIDKVKRSAERTGEPVWHLPLPDQYRRMIDSDVADLRNIGNGRGAGTLTAGLFLKEFVAGVPWVHLDIAGPARSGEDDAYLPKGGTGFGVRTVVDAVTSFKGP